MPPHFDPAAAQHMDLCHPELVLMLEKATVNDRSVEGLIRKVEGVKDGGMLHMLHNSVNI
jgi:hypothetical protein